MIRSSIIFHTFGARGLTNVQQSAFVTGQSHIDYGKDRLPHGNRPL